MFQNHYTFFNTTVVCTTVRTAVAFKHEDKLNEFLKKHSRKCHWRYFKIDTTAQMGFPDILLLKTNEYWQIESKMLKNKKLVSIEDNLKWQFGQLSYMQRALSMNLNYILAVAKDNNIAFIKGATNESTQCTDYPDFIERL